MAAGRWEHRSPHSSGEYFVFLEGRFKGLVKRVRSGPGWVWLTNYGDPGAGEGDGFQECKRAVEECHRRWRAGVRRR